MGHFSLLNIFLTFLYSLALSLLLCIIGFEAWSSQREPSQCLNLLETIYDGLDRISRSQGIFKAESSADCYTGKSNRNYLFGLRLPFTYSSLFWCLFQFKSQHLAFSLPPRRLAATGLPEPRPDHAEAMIRFANDCLKKFRATTKALEVSLGPDTSELMLRVGIHSGPVTAIRRHSRFQLFGDTVTSANSIMSNSMGGRIHLSQETVDLIPEAFRSQWAKPREQLVGGNGAPGTMTYWLSPSALAMSDDSKRNASARNLMAFESEADRIPRLVDWNVQLLKRVLNQMASQRSAVFSDRPLKEDAVDRQLRDGKLVIDEVEEVVKLPKYRATRSRSFNNQLLVEVSDEVEEQLREYITAIAHSYKDNPFHNCKFCYYQRSILY